MRYIARENSGLEGWDIIDTQSLTTSGDDGEPVWVMTIFDSDYVERTLEWLNDGGFK